MGILALFIAVGCHFWTVARVGGWNQPMAFLVFFCWPAAIIPLVILWGDDEHDIRLPYFCGLGFALLALVTLNLRQTPQEEGMLQALQWFA